jgi:hypothetical protein
MDSLILYAELSVHCIHEFRAEQSCHRRHRMTRQLIGPESNQPTESTLGIGLAVDIYREVRGAST